MHREIRLYSLAHIVLDTLRHTHTHAHLCVYVYTRLDVGNKQTSDLFEKNRFRGKRTLRWSKTGKRDQRDRILMGMLG